jgi:Protein of unknown function (DUF2934)
MSAAPALLRDPAQRKVEPDHTSTNPVERSDERFSTPMQEDIARLAYAIWQQRGCQADSAEQDWIEAERQLRRPVPNG